MPNWDPKRWMRLPNGSYRRRVAAYADRNRAKPAYASMTRERLIAESKRRGIASYGTKQVLVERLEKNDAEAN